MAKPTTRQRRTAGRVMHEFKHGELKSGPEARGGKVKSREQAIAIALKESGASRYESPCDNARNERRSERKEAQGRTGQQEREGKARVGAAGRFRKHGGDAPRSHEARALRKGPAKKHCRTIAHDQGGVAGGFGSLALSFR